MAKIFVDDGGSNTSPYETWAKAATTLQTALTAWTAADVIYVGHDHNETISADFTATNDSVTDYIPIFSCDSSAGGSVTTYLKASSAQFTVTTAWDLDIYAVLYGLYWDCNLVQQNPQDPSSVLFIDCTLLDHGSYDVDSVSELAWKKCTFTGTANNFKFSVDSISIFECCDFACDFFNNTILGEVGHAGSVRFIGGDLNNATGLTAVTNDSVYNTRMDSHIEIQGTGYPAALSVTEGDATNATAWRPYVTVAGDDNYYAVGDPRGTTIADTGIYYNSGWLDVEDSARLSYKITANAACTPHEYTQSGWLQGEHVATSGAKTITIQAWEDHTAALQDDEAWVELLYPATATSPALTGFLSTQTYTGVQTQADLTAGAGLGNWTGETGGRSVKFVLSPTFANAGSFLWRLCLGKYEAGKQLNFDIKTVIT